MKSLFRSRVFWLAVVQAVVGVIAVFASSYPEVGGLLVAKSVADIVLRVVTSVPVKI